MPLTEIINGMRAIYRQLDDELDEFRRRCGFGCPSGCGHCCESPQVEATELEMLPLALTLAGSGAEPRYYEAARQQQGAGCCVFFQARTEAGAPGHCGVYPHRPIVCRLFSFSGNRDKDSRLRMVACALIRQADPLGFERAAREVREGRWSVPQMSAYAMRVAALNPQLTRERLPVNRAFMRAMERVGLQQRLRDSKTAE